MKPQDPRGAHCRIYHDLMNSPAWRALSLAERGLWLEMRRELKSYNNGDISATMGTLVHRGLGSPTTLAKHLRALTAVGFLACTREGGIARGAVWCSLYRFTDEPTFDHLKINIKKGPPTNDWKAFASVGAAKDALKKARRPTASPRLKAAYKNRKRIQELDPEATETVLDRPFHAPVSVVQPSSPTTVSGEAAKRRTTRKAAPSLSFA